MWALAIVFGLFGLLQSSGTVELDSRYGYFAVHVAFVIGGALFAPLHLAITALVLSGTILYFAERWYARLWDHPRLWWYKFFQGQRCNAK